MNVHLRFKKKFITDVENYSELYLAVPPPTLTYTTALQAGPPPGEGWTGDSDLWLCHQPGDLRS